MVDTVGSRAAAYSGRDVFGEGHVVHRGNYVAESEAGEAAVGVFLGADGVGDAGGFVGGAAAGERVGTEGTWATGGR